MWTAIAILAGSQIATLAYLGSKIDGLDARLTSRIDSLSDRIDSLDDRLTTRIDAVLTRIADHELGNGGHRHGQRA